MSKLFKLNLKDFGKGILMAIIGSVTAGALNALQTGQVIDPKVMGTGAAVAGLSYIVKNVFSNSDGKFLTPEQK